MMKWWPESQVWADQNWTLNVVLCFTVATLVFVAVCTWLDRAARRWRQSKIAERGAR